MVLTADYGEQKRGFEKWKLGEQRIPRGKSNDAEQSARCWSTWGLGVTAVPEAGG